MDAKVMVKSLAPLIMISAILGGFSFGSAAQEAYEGDMRIGQVTGGLYTGREHNNVLFPPFSPFLPGAMAGHSPYPNPSVYSGTHGPGDPGLGSSRPFPRMLLPLPINSPIWGFQTRYGFQYPGSYLPPGTPLHRYNGYVVCDPPAAAAGKRIVKITTTRSLAAPADTQPCPVYTINGGIPEGKSYTTTSTPSATRNSPP
jgi:hypothetical protein